MPNSPSPYHPTPRDLIQLNLPTDVKVSPKGTYVAINVRMTNWAEDRYETVCKLYNCATNETHILTRMGNVQQVEWLDEQTLGVNKTTNGEEQAQVYLYEGLTGDGWAVTAHEDGVHWFAPFADGLLYLANRPDDETAKQREADFGHYTHFEQETSKTALYYVGLAELRTYEEQLRKSTPEEAKQLVRPVVELSKLLPNPVSIRRVIPCPTGKAIYLNCWTRDDLVYDHTVHSYRISLDAPLALTEQMRRAQDDAADGGLKEATTAQKEIAYLGELTRLSLPAGAYLSAVSPDGTRLLVAYQERDRRMFTRSDLWLLNTDMASSAQDAQIVLQTMQNLSATLDRDLLNIQWVEAGIFAGYVDGCVIRAAQFAENGTVTPLDFRDIFLTNAFHVSASGAIGLLGTNRTQLPEVYLAKATAGTNEWALTQLTDFGAAVADWQFGTVETIRWQSLDGTEIEGVLRKPANFDPNKQYPLVFVVHGGPRGYSDASLLTGPDRTYYPAIQFANQDVLVLYPNYRGSTGRGQAFTELNVNNLGIGDLWDLESGLDYLIEQGWVDPDRVGCMGWSQGGYISAFAGLHSERFCAVSVGAGISDWYTYHISNDIPRFTTDYLSGSPFENRTYYSPTAPMSNIANAKTPMLIQHGSEDKRVPLSNAMELYRGLQAMQVPVELFIYPGMGHPIAKPRENHAVMCQNLTWFGHYLLGWALVDRQM